MPQPGAIRRVLIADDEDTVLACYLRAFSAYQRKQRNSELEELDAILFDTEVAKSPDDAAFEVVTCTQGDEAVAAAREALEANTPFNVVILDIRMPPGITGVQAGEQIRALDPDVALIFVTGYSDTSQEELVARIPPPSRLQYLNKPLSFRKLVDDLATLGV
jgi:CheY-like chemotaxis protein